MNNFDVIVVGGGAAGFFTAINIAEFNSTLKIALLEKAKTGLQKVKISGGGRCNVTHAEFIPNELIENYPRGRKELLGPFHRFMTSDTIEWFQKRGVELKIEEDGRMFPISDSSDTIVNCFLEQSERLNISIFYSCGINKIEKENKRWMLQSKDERFYCESVVIATGSSSKIWNLLETLGHTIVPPVPSLFTFNIEDERIKGLAGISIDNVEVELKLPEMEMNSSDSLHFSSVGPLLITHWGLSAPSILKLSAFAARELAKCQYNFDIEVNFIGLSVQDCVEKLQEYRNTIAKKSINNTVIFDLPKRFLNKLYRYTGIDEGLNWADINKAQIIKLADELCSGIYKVRGKSTFKEEFVTAGGVELKEIDFKTYQSKIHNNLYFAGEVLNIDAVTGGFNFQNAWTGGYIVSRAISSTEETKN